jgi:hypothetical protein
MLNYQRVHPFGWVEGTGKKSVCVTMFCLPRVVVGNNFAGKKIAA